MNDSINGLRASIHRILRDEKRSPHPEQWSVQGFGMLRMYLDEKRIYRLNIWDNRIAKPDVSLIHDHPWHFTSWVLTGALTNERFCEAHPDNPHAADFEYTIIKCGPGGGRPEGGQVRHCKLRSRRLESFLAGESYGQDADEIHQTTFEDGTVTLNERHTVGDGHHARVFWLKGQHWVDAEPRQAAVHEIDMVLDRALSIWHTSRV